MGRQVQFHVLPEDLDVFLRHARATGDVVVILRDGDGPAVHPVANPETRRAR